MDYLSEYYKNQCRELSSKKLQLENQVKILKFKTFLIEKDGGMFTNASGSNRSGELVSYTPQAGIEDIWRWIIPGTPTPGPGVVPPGRPGGSPTPGPTPRPPKQERPWTPGQKYEDSTPQSPAGPDGRPRPSPGINPPGPPHGVPPAKQMNPRGTAKPVSAEPNPRQSMLNGQYYFLASDGTIYRWNPSTGQWDRYVGPNTPWGPTRDGRIPGVRGYN